MSATDTYEDVAVSRVGLFGTTLTFGHNNRKSKGLDSPKLAKGAGCVSRQTLYYDALDQLDSEDATPTQDTRTSRDDRPPDRPTRVLQEEAPTQEARDDYLTRSAAVRARLARSLRRLDALSSEQTRVYTQLKTALAAATASQEQLATAVAGIAMDQQPEPRGEAPAKTPSRPKASSFAVTLLRTPSRVLKHFRSRKHARADQSAQPGPSSQARPPVPTVVVLPPSDTAQEGQRRVSPAYEV